MSQFTILKYETGMTQKDTDLVEIIWHVGKILDDTQCCGQRNMRPAHNAQDRERDSEYVHIR